MNKISFNLLNVGGILGVIFYIFVFSTVFIRLSNILVITIELFISSIATILIVSGLILSDKWKL